MLAVFVWHVASRIIIPRGYAPGLTFGDTGNRVFATFQLGIYVFFALSGYLLARPFIEAFVAGRSAPNVATYLRRRLLRIVPCFWLVAAVLLLRHGFHGASPLDVAAIFGFAQTVHLQPVSLPITQAWTLDIEMLFYLLLPAVAIVLTWSAGRVRRGRLRLWLVTLAVAGLCAPSFAHGMHFSSLVGGEPEPLDMVWVFAPGIALAALEVLKGPQMWGWMAGRWVAAGLAIGGLGMFAWTATLSATALPERTLAGALGGAMLVASPLLVQWTHGTCPRALDNRVLHWIGQRSYSIYLIHYGVLLELSSIFNGGSGPWTAYAIAFAVGLAITLAISHFLFITVEGPAIRLGHRRRTAGASRSRAEGVGSSLPTAGATPAMRREQSGAFARRTS